MMVLTRQCREPNRSAKIYTTQKVKDIKSALTYVRSKYYVCTYSNLPPGCRSLKDQVWIANTCTIHVHAQFCI